MVRRIDGAAGIPVLQPGAADGIVLLQDLEGDPHLLEPDGGAEAGETGADDDAP